LPVGIDALPRVENPPEAGGGRPAWLRARLPAGSLSTKAKLLFVAVGMLVVLEIVLAVVYYARSEDDLEHIRSIEHLAYGLVGISTQGQDLLRDLTIPLPPASESAGTLAEHWMADLNAMRPEGLLTAALDPRDVTAFEYDLRNLERQLQNGLRTAEQHEAFRSGIEMAVTRYVTQAHSTLMDLRRRDLGLLEDAKTRRQRLMLVFVGLCVVGFLGIAASGGLFIARLIGTLAVLERRSHRIAAGDYGEPLPVTRSDEVGHLIEGINAMAAKLAVRDREIAATRQAAAQQEKMLALGTLAATIAHEVGNPIQAIIAVCDQLADGLRTAPCAHRDIALGHIDTIAENAGRMARTIDEVRNFARPSVPEPQRFDLNRVVQTTLRLMRFEPRLARLTLEFEPTEEPLFVDGVPDHFVQVLMNLLINAVDAVDPEDGWILVTTRRIRNNVILSVSDNGPGIPEAVRKAVFDPFFTTKPEGKGTGLGLSICRSIVRDHGGRIEIADSVECGASVTIRLPYSGCAA